MNRRRIGLALVGIVLAAVAALGLVFGWAHRSLHAPHAGWSGPAVVVELAPGLDAGSMLDRLADAGVIRDPRLLRAWLAWRGGAERLHAGEYRFADPLSPLEVLERLRRGDVMLHSVTLPEGLTLWETANRLADAGFGDFGTLAETFMDPTPIVDLDAEAEDLEGYLFPDTYHFRRGETPQRIAETMVGRFREVTSDGLVGRTAAVGFTLRQAVVLASLIEKETSVPEERSRISGVFHNRLARGMRLECDPTVIYALRREGVEIESLRYRHLETDSPWNTYRVVGLPAGPIANPGLASLRAAVEPLEGDELYFVAAPGGGHRFSKNLAGHLRAVAEWRRYVKSSR